MLSAPVSPIPYSLAMAVCVHTHTHTHSDTHTHMHRRPAPATSDLLHPFIHALRASRDHSSDVVGFLFHYFLRRGGDDSRPFHPSGNKITPKATDFNDVFRNCWKWAKKRKKKNGDFSGIQRDFDLWTSRDQACECFWILVGFLASLCWFLCLLKGRIRQEVTDGLISECNQSSSKDKPHVQF